MIRLRWLLVLFSLGSAVAQTPKIAGDFSGMLGPLHGKLHTKTSVGTSADAAGTSARAT